MRRLAWMAAVSAILVSVPAVAVASPHAPKPVRVAAHFTRSKLGTGALRLATGWVTVTRGTTVTLIDKSTGATTTVTMPAGCVPTDASRTQLLLACPPTEETQDLESIATGQVSPVALNPMLDCNLNTMVDCPSVSHLGTDWMSVDVPCSMAEHCVDTVSFQNLATGNVADDPSSPTVIADLDSPALAHKLCAPVTIPASQLGFGLPTSGFAQMDGQFAVVAGVGGTYLEKCGSKLRQHLMFKRNAVFNRHVVLWQSKPGLLKGIFLPSLKPFTLTIPRTVDRHATASKFAGDDPYELALAHGMVYFAAESFSGPNEPLWTMPMPSTPPKKKLKPRH